MTKYINIGDSIEGENISIYARKYIAGIKINIKGVGYFYRYKCKINSKSEILKELYPKKAKINIKAHLNLGDILKAEVIEIYSSEFLKFLKEANYSSTHGIQFAESKCHSSAEICIPFNFVQNRKRLN